MALYRKADFVKLCGIQSKHLTTFIARGNVIVENGLIDGDNPTNKFFIEKKQDKTAPQKAEIGLPIIKNQPSKVTLSPDEETPGESLYLLDKKKKQLDIEKITVETRLLVLREDKQRGEVIPVGIVNNLIVQLMQNVVSESKNISDNMISVVSKKAGLNVNEIAILRSEQARSINLAVDKAIESTKKQLSSIINDFAIKKEVGEHE